MSRGAGFAIRATWAAAAALFLTLIAAMFALGSAATGASADTVPCLNQYGQPVPCPTTTVPPPTTAPPTTQPPPPTTQPPPPTTARPPVTAFNPPVTAFNPPVTAAPVTVPPTTAAPTTIAPTTTAPPTVPTGPPAILGNFNTNAHVTTTTVDPSPPSTATEAAVGLPTSSKGGRLSARFIYAMVLDGLLLMGIGGYVVVRRLHLI